MDYDMDSMVKFCMVALEATVHGKVAFKCPLCGATARILPYRWKMRALCKRCSKYIDW